MAKDNRPKTKNPDSSMTQGLDEFKEGKVRINSKGQIEPKKLSKKDKASKIKECKVPSKGEGWIDKTSNCKKRQELLEEDK
jgi:hypothetical protein